MSLGLVSYDDSEESEDEIEESVSLERSVKSPSDDISVELKTSTAETKKVLHNGSENISDEEVEQVQDSEKPVTLHLPESKLSLVNTDFDIKCLTSSNKRNGPVRITVPSLNEVEEESEPPSKKKLKPSQKGSGLFALLPSPKSTLVPQSVANRKPNVTTKKPPPVAAAKPKPAPKPPVVNKPSSLINYEDSGDEDEPSGSIDFFSLESKENDVTPAPIDVIDITDISEPTIHKKPVENSGGKTLNFSSNSHPSNWPETPDSLPSSSSYDPRPQPPPADQYTTSEFVSFSNNDLELDQEAMQQLCGRRDRLKMQEVNIIDVSGDSIMPDSREWLTKQLTEEQSHRSSHKRKDGPTMQQRRKHQITYLAFQAKENELELKNQWANNRMSRKQTQAKYGF